MNSIALPKNITFLPGDRENEGLVVIEPCYPGYGITLGNSLRRVLLSSLPGAAVVGVKIDGATHEFMSLPHIKEDVLEIILNIKKMRFKLFSDEIVKLELEAHGEKTVTAADIAKNSQAEVTNPDLAIAHITDMAGKLKIEIYVAGGRGYETYESRERKEKEIGYIEMDSFFSPVLGVGINVENVRVGKMTNWDKLSLRITTDGTIKPEEAYFRAVDILLDQFRALTETAAARAAADEEEMNAQEEPTDEEEMNAQEEPTDEEAAAEEPAEILDEQAEAPKKKRGRPKKS